MIDPRLLAMLGAFALMALFLFAGGDKTPPPPAVLAGGAG